MQFLLDHNGKKHGKNFRPTNLTKIKNIKSKYGYMGGNE